MSGLFGKLPDVVSIDRQIRAAKRELSMRAHKYPQWVSAGRMKQAEADEEIAAMRAIVETLQRVKESPR